MPSTGLVVEPAVFNTVHMIFDLENYNENNESCRKYSRGKYDKYCTDLMLRLA